MTQDTGAAITPRRIGVVGLGNFARSVHLPNLSRIPEVETRAFCDVDAGLLQSLADRYEVPGRFRDYRHMIREAGLDALLVTVRDDLQAEVAVEGLRAGLHVYVEKPLSSDPEVCRRVLDEAARVPHARLVVGYNKRFSPMYQRARDILSRHGRPWSIHLAMTDDAWRWARGYEPGHLLALDVCHHFDLIAWLTASPITSVYCVSARPEEDLLLVTTASGCNAGIMFSGNASMDTPKEYVRIIGDRFSLAGEDYVELFVHGLEDEPESYRFACSSGSESPPLPLELTAVEGISGWRTIRRIAWRRYRNQDPGSFIPNFLRDQGWYGSLRSFVQAIATGRETDHAGAADACAVAEVTAAALKSRTSGRVEAVTSQ